MGYGASLIRQTEKYRNESIKHRKTTLFKHISSSSLVKSSGRKKDKE